MTVRELILTEAGYRCAVPTCRLPTPIDVHHIETVEDGGTDDPENLIALCAACHARHHRYKEPSRDALLVYKTVLKSLVRSYDWETVDLLLFLHKTEPNLRELHLSGDGLLKFARLVVSDLVEYKPIRRKGYVTGLYNMYELELTDTGRRLIELWKSGDLQALKAALVPIGATTDQGGRSTE